MPPHEHQPHQHPPHDHEPQGEVITIVEPSPAEAASSVHFTAEDLARRPHNTPSELLRQTPGLLVSQHAGGGKADQLFLRGFDADHGTDVALFIDGVPANLTSHGHGQGYADTHWLIPETVASIDVHKGPYGARFGDFYTAGAIDMRTIDEVPRPRLSLTGGTELTGPAAFEDPTFRLVAMASPTASAGTSSLLAAEVSYTDGPFEHPQNFRRGLVFGKWRGPLAGGELTFLTTAYAARWNQSGQIPERAVNAGELGRFGAVDPTEGGASSRASLSLAWAVPDSRGGSLRLQTYLVDYRLRLFSNFTLFARDPVNGDQIEQTDARTITGVSATYTRAHEWGPISGLLHMGVQTRFDDVETGLFQARQRARLATCFDEGTNPCNQVASAVRNVALFAEEDVQLRPWLRALAGLRYDMFVWDVDDLDPETALTPATTGGTAQRALVSPKLSLVATPHRTTEVFVNGGLGFHSNDARGAVSSGGKGALARAIGAEVGTRVRPIDGLSLSLAAWYLRLSSEQVWSGDAGGTEPSDPSRRIGLDFDLTWNPTRWLTLDGNVALARSRFVPNEGNGGAVALAPRIIGGGGITAHRPGSSVALRARGVGDRPASEDETLTADGFLVLDLVASHELGPWGLGLTVYNLLDTDWREAQFAETSQLPGEPQPVEDVHFTPGTPLAALVTIQYSY